MSPMMKILRDLLLLFVKRIEDGDCNLEDSETGELISVMRKYTDKDERMSKYQACEHLKISRATFDNYVTNGLIPKGIHQQGFKEIYWLKKDLDKFKKERDSK